MGHRRARALVVDQTRYRWAQSHSHRAAPDGSTPRLRQCSEHVRVSRDGAPGRLDVVFAEGPGRLVSGGYFMHAGAVVRGDDYVNLNRPGVVRALLDEALSRGWRPEDPRVAEFDGWAMFDAVLARLPATEPAVGTPRATG